MMRPAGLSAKPRRSSEQGYVLLVLILFVALLSIALVAALPSMKFEMKRDREEELIHRGVQYTRAIQHYVKKFGRYPTTLEQLENTNQIRFLRRRYKDPFTGKDFRLLHMQDVQTSFGPGIGGATPVSQMVPGAGPGAGGFGGGFGGGAFGNAGPGAGGFGGQGFGGSNFGGQGIQQVGFGGNTAQAGGFGQSSSGSFGSQTSQGGGDTDTGTSSSPNASGGNSSSGGFGSSSSSSSSSSSNQVFGGGPIVGVASTSKEKTIRVFDKKERYEQWQFIYNPAMDRGGLLTGPAQPSLQGAVSAGAVAAGQGNQGTGTQTFGGQGLGGSTFGGQPNQPNSPVSPPSMPPEQ